MIQGDGSSTPGKSRRGSPAQLSYKGWSLKPLMQPGRYTELFFLDEATALSAGHRPCGQCRKPAYTLFKSHWLQSNSRPSDTTIADVDKALHAERTNRSDDGDWLRPLDSLPSGVLVHWNTSVHLWNGAELRQWPPTGYGAATDVAKPSMLVLLRTPPSVVNAIAAGYTIQMHPTAFAVHAA